MQTVPPPYAALPLVLLRLDNLRPPAKLLWGYLRFQEGRGWTRLPCRTYLAAVCGIDRATVSRGLAELCKHNPPLLLLEQRYPGRNAPWRYRTAAVPPGPKLPQRRRDVQNRAPPCAETAHLTDNSTEHEKRKEKNGTDSFPPEFAQGLTTDQQRVVRTAFPHGCTRAQFQCLMQAVTSAERLGVPHTFMAYALLADNIETKPWLVIEQHIKRLLTDVHDTACQLEEQVYSVATYRRFLDLKRGDPKVSAWVRGTGGPARRERANALLAWPKGA